MTPQRLFEHFNEIAEAPDAVPRLRRFILDLAVRGKLVEQDPKDEPASELLKRIEAERIRLVKEAGIHSQELLFPIGAEDVPFDIPGNWKWVRIGNLGLTQTGTTPPKADGSLFGNYIPFLKPNDLLPSGVNYQNEGLSEAGLSASGRRAPTGTLLMVCIGTIGKCQIVDRECSFNQQINALTTYSGIDSKYLFQAVSSNFFQEAALRASSRTTIAILNKGKWEKLPIPLPPLPEQHRIVAKVDELIALCDELEAAQQKRERRRDRLVAVTLNGIDKDVSGRDGSGRDGSPSRPIFGRDRSPNGPVLSGSFGETALPKFFLNHLPRLTTRPEHIVQLRQTILNLAVRGKLVPPDPNDEPASELLKRIQAEKARLVKEGKIRKQDLQAKIDAIGIPFALPERWAWARLGEVIHLVSGQHLQPGEYSDQQQSGLPYITGPADFGQNGLVITRYAVVRKAVAKKGQILLTVKGAGVGKTAICDLPEVAISRQLMSMTPIGWSYPYLLLTTHRLAEALKESARSLIPGISREDVDQFVFPLPPLAEQHRIVAKVDELMALCDRLETQLTTTQTESGRLLEAVLHQALAPAAAG